MGSTRSPAWLAWMPAFVFAAGLAFFAVMSSPAAFPGASAGFITQYTGLDPLLPIANPVWHACVRILKAVPLGSIAARLNAFSVVCGALSLSLLYSLMCAVPHDRTTEESRVRSSSPWPGVVSGLTSAGVLLASAPFWMIATRAHPLSFDILLLLALVWLLVKYIRTGRYAWAALFAVFLGVCLNEYAGLALLAPVMGVTLLFYLWRHEHLTVKGVGGLALLGLLGLSICFLNAAVFYGTDAFEWRGYNGWFQIVRVFWRDQVFEVSRSVPRLGWLIVLLVSFIPWLAVVAIPKRVAENIKGSQFGSYVLHLAVAVVVGGAVFNAPYSPWTMLGPRTLVVTPYVFMASTLGYLAGYGFVLLWAPARSPRRGPAGALKAILRPVYPLGPAVFVGALLVLNAPAMNMRVGKDLDRTADRVLDDLQGRSWLVSNGVLDEHIRLAAHERGRRVHIINPRLGRSPAYRRYLSSLFTDARLRGLARVGVSPLLDEWLADHPDAVEKLAVLSIPDLFELNNIQPVPQPSLYLAGVDFGEMARADLMADHREFWSSVAFPAAGQETGGRVAGPYSDWLLRDMSKRANNTGVYFEREGDLERAWEAYQAARTINPENLSALLNSLALARTLERPELEALEQEFEEIRTDRTARYNLWTLSRLYGYVSRPEAYASRGVAWAMSGKPNAGVRDIKRAIEMSGEDTGQLQLVLASLYASQDDVASSRKVYIDLLENNPNNAPALLGLARLSIRRRQFEEAEQYLDRLEQLKVPLETVERERAAILAMKGNLAEAKEVFREICRDNPDDIQAWTALALVTAELGGDPETVNKALHKISRSRTQYPNVLFAVARILMSQQNFDGARDVLNRLTRLRPGNEEALEMLLRLDIISGLRDYATEHVEQLLAVNSQNAFGNWVLAQLQMHEGDLALAEESLRTSVQNGKIPESYVDLAWVLQFRDVYQEALTYAREATQLDPDYSPCWHTLGLILIRLDRLAEAEDALQQALELKPDNAYAKLYTALLYEKRGLNEEARALVDELMLNPSRLKSGAIDMARSLSRRLR